MHARLLFVTAFAALFPVGLAAQQPRPRPAGSAADSARAKRDTLEAVVVKAVRASTASAAAQSVVTRDDIAKTYLGQDAPLALSSAPSMTAYSEAGGFSGYSYIRLRGIDQTRLNITVDGIPLNDPEDQVLYFSNVPDFLNSMQSVQIQRGVGASTFGTASYGGSMNFESVPLATTPRGGEADLSGGSFNTMRASAQYSTGLADAGWSAYARVTKQHTDGYREHSGNDAQSAFVSGGWFGARDAVKFTGFAGVSGTREAYLAASEADLAVDRRVNPLTDAEGDRFHQEMASVQYSRALADGMTFTVTGYRNSAAGAYDVNVGSDVEGAPIIDNFYLAHVWYGAVSTLTVSRGPMSLEIGTHLSDYHREHAAAERPNLTDRQYTNVGFKQDQSGFAKLAYDLGAFRVSADVQLRRAAFRYQPSTNAGLGEQSVSWNFVNPKAGVSWRGAGAARALALYASYGRTQREPARGDLFAGADDLNADNAASILPLTRVQPETVHDLEVGASWVQGNLSISANLFDMEFRNEIAPIGALSLTGSPLRQNVAASYRRGLEFEGSWRATDRVTASANLTVMKARILAYTDESAGLTYLDVAPLLTPPTISNQRIEVRLTNALSLLATGRYVDRSYLANDGDANFTTPPFWMFDGTLAWRHGPTELRLQLFNLFDTKAYAAGYRDGDTRYFYPIATRNVMLSTRFTF